MRGSGSGGTSRRPRPSGRRWAGRQRAVLRGAARGGPGVGRAEPTCDADPAGARLPRRLPARARRRATTLAARRPVTSATRTGGCAVLLAGAVALLVVALATRRCSRWTRVGRRRPAGLRGARPGERRSTSRWWRDPWPCAPRNAGCRRTAGRRGLARRAGRAVGVGPARDVHRRSGIPRLQQGARTRRAGRRPSRAPASVVMATGSRLQVVDLATGELGPEFDHPVHSDRTSISVLHVSADGSRVAQLMFDAGRARPLRNLREPGGRQRPRLHAPHRVRHRHAASGSSVRCPLRSAVATSRWTATGALVAVTGGLNGDLATYDVGSGPARRPAGRAAPATRTPTACRDTGAVASTEGARLPRFDAPVRSERSMHARCEFCGLSPRRRCPATTTWR